MADTFDRLARRYAAGGGTGRGPVPPQWADDQSYAPAPSTVDGMTAPGNINVYDRPQAHNADGSISTVRSMSYNSGGGERLVPTVSNEGHVMAPRQAMQYWLDRGQSLGTFATPDSADAYARALHLQQEHYYGLDRYAAGGLVGQPNDPGQPAVPVPYVPPPDGPNTWQPSGGFWENLPVSDNVEDRRPLNPQHFQNYQDYALEHMPAAYRAGPLSYDPSIPEIPVDPSTWDAKDYLAWRYGRGVHQSDAEWLAQRQHEREFTTEASDLPVRRKKFEDGGDAGDGGEGEGEGGGGYGGDPGGGGWGDGWGGGNPRDGDVPGGFDGGGYGGASPASDPGSYSGGATNYGGNPADRAEGLGAMGPGEAYSGGPGASGYGGSYGGPSDGQDQGLGSYGGFGADAQDREHYGDDFGTSSADDASAAFGGDARDVAGYGGFRNGIQDHSLRELADTTNTLANMAATNVLEARHNYGDMLGVSESLANRAAMGFGNLNARGVPTSIGNRNGVDEDGNPVDFSHAINNQMTSPRQYSAFNDGVQPAFNRAQAELSANPTLAQNAFQAAEDAYYGNVVDPTMGATMYRADYVNPSWASLSEPQGSVHIGGQTFSGMVGGLGRPSSPDFGPTAVAATAPTAPDAPAAPTGPYQSTPTVPQPDSYREYGPSVDLSGFYTGLHPDGGFHYATPSGAVDQSINQIATNYPGAYSIGVPDVAPDVPADTPSTSGPATSLRGPNTTPSTAYGGWMDGTTAPNTVATPATPDAPSTGLPTPVAPAVTPTPRPDAPAHLFDPQSFAAAYEAANRDPASLALNLARLSSGNVSQGEADKTMAYLDWLRRNQITQRSA